MTHSGSCTVFILLKIVAPFVGETSSFEASRAGMNKPVEDNNYLDFPGEK